MIEQLFSVPLDGLFACCCTLAFTILMLARMLDHEFGRLKRQRELDWEIQASHDAQLLKRVMELEQNVSAIEKAFKELAPEHLEKMAAHLDKLTAMCDQIKQWDEEGKRSFK